MQGNWTPRPLALAVLAALAGSGMTAQAQGTAAALPEVKVTDTGSTTEGSYTARELDIGKTGQSPREIPQSISVVTRQQLDDRNLTKLEDVLKSVTGVNITRFDGAGNYNTIQARGFDIGAVLLDGLPVAQGPNYATALDLALYDRIEVLRGPAGLLQGSGEPGGAVNLVRKRAMGTLKIGGNAMLGSFGLRRLDADLTGPLNAAGTLRGRVVVVEDRRDSFVDLLFSNKHAAYGTLELDVGPSTTLSVGGPLAGVPIAHKDIFVTRDFPTTAGSKMLQGYRSPFDATTVARLADAGAVTLGKLNCDEFAMGSSNENSAYGVVHNPWDATRIPGGSSGGSAAAVAARLAPAATGTDTGGSIRQPAAFCGITGIKPTYGRASRYGMVAFASSLDQAGPMARTAEDCALLLSSICGPDPDRDATSLDHPAEDFSLRLNDTLDGLRIGVPREFFGDGLAADVRAALDAALKEYEKLGARLVEISLPRTELAIPVYYIIAPAEASSNLSRFDGVKFGHRAAQYGDLLDMYKKTRAEGFGDEVKRRIMVGTYVLSHGYYDAYYLKAQQIRRMIADDFQQAFASCDVIAGPVAPTVAWKLGDKADDPVANYLADVYTLPGSLAGLPGMSVPCGFSEVGMQNTGTGIGKPMPVGLQLIGNYFAEAKLLNAAHRFQQATDFHLRTPEGF